MRQRYYLCGSESTPHAGIIVVLDDRILAKQYGQAFLDSLPKFLVEVL